MVQNKDTQFFMENLKIKRRKDILDLPEQGFEPQLFSNLPVHDLNFHVKRGAQDQIQTSF